MEKYVSSEVKSLLHFIGNDKKAMMDDFYHTCLHRKYQEYSDSSLMLLEDKNHFSLEDSDILRRYSGFRFRDINNALRGTWNYEENGHISQQEKFLHDADRIRDSIKNNAFSIGNAKVFRGVSLSYFKNYQVKQLQDLAGLKGCFLYDSAFVSTSFSEQECFYQKDNELGIDYNVEIVYLIPEEFCDGIPLFGVSYSPNQKEYLINSGNLARVVDVQLENDSAKVSALMIPKQVYDDYYVANHHRKNKQKVG